MTSGKLYWGRRASEVSMKTILLLTFAGLALSVVARISAHVVADRRTRTRMAASWAGSHPYMPGPM